MNGQFAIRNKKNNKWLTLDFHDGSEIIHVDELTQATLFATSDDAELFLLDHNSAIADHELNQLNVYAKTVKW